ncbi:MAG: hypothetical protein OXD47_11570 [Gammaproteobacteria bacterium]|nr:hypothetical protein [Gammaproteobacteria bacterium]
MLERHAGKPALGEIDYLLHAPDDRAGALSFGVSSTPPTGSVQFNQVMHLERLQKIAMAVINDEPLTGESHQEQVRNLMMSGTSIAAHLSIQDFFMIDRGA